MKKLPTDLQILNAIYERYYQSFAEGEKNRGSKVYVPIDLKQVAEALEVDVDIVFGRLHYHLEKKYGYKHDDGTSVPFFTLVVGHDQNCVNFPLLASVLSNLREEDRKYKIAMQISVISLIVSIGAILVSMLYRP